MSPFPYPNQQPARRSPIPPAQRGTYPRSQSATTIRLFLDRTDDHLWIPLPMNLPTRAQLHAIKKFFPSSTIAVQNLPLPALCLDPRLSSEIPFLFKRPSDPKSPPSRRPQPSLNNSPIQSLDLLRNPSTRHNLVTKHLFRQSKVTLPAFSGKLNPSSPRPDPSPQPRPPPNTPTQAPTPNHQRKFAQKPSPVFTSPLRCQPLPPPIPLRPSIQLP